MPPIKPCSRSLFALPFALLFLMAAIFPACGQSPANPIFSARAEKEFRLRQAAFNAAPAVDTNCWQFARACFDWCGFATNETQRADIAKLGITAASQLVARDPKSAPGHYYLAMDYGELAQAEAPSLAAYKLVKEIEREFKTAADLDEHFDFAGPSRNLGLLYRDAPGWPFSIGSKRNARDNLEKAAALAPGYPENQLNLAESQLRWRLKEETGLTLKKLDAVWPAAQTNFTGVIWEESWSDWTARRAAVKTDFQKVYKHVP